MTENWLTKKYFAGTYASDHLPTIQNEGKNHYIVNFDPSNEPGSHWIAIILNKNRPSEYFDSYGFPPPKHLPFEEFMQGNFIFNTVELQSPLTTVCGQYCMHFLMQRARGYNMRDIVSDFSHDKAVNDLLVNTAVEETFGTDLKVIDIQLLTKCIQRSGARQAE